jgi:hypothetical protein
MKRALIVGFFAGFIAGIVKAGLFIGVLWQLFSFIPYQALGVQGAITLYVLHTAIWGIIFGALYEFFYDYIPGKAVRKGLVYGLILWVTTIVYQAIISFMYGYYQWAFQDMIAGFISICITYGIMIGYLYKK